MPSNQFTIRNGQVVSSEAQPKVTPSFSGRGHRLGGASSTATTYEELSRQTEERARVLHQQVAREAAEKARRARADKAANAAEQRMKAAKLKPSADEQRAVEAAKKVEVAAPVTLATPHRDGQRMINAVNRAKAARAAEATSANPVKKPVKKSSPGLFAQVASFVRAAASSLSTVASGWFAAKALTPSTPSQPPVVDKPKSEVFAMRESAVVSKPSASPLQAAGIDPHKAMVFTPEQHLECLIKMYASLSTILLQQMYSEQVSGEAHNVAQFQMLFNLLSDVYQHMQKVMHDNGIMMVQQGDMCVKAEADNQAEADGPRIEEITDEEASAAPVINVTVVNGNNNQVNTGAARKANMSFSSHQRLAIEPPKSDEAASAPLRIMRSPS